MNIEKPQARSLILCDYFVVEESTRNVSLINCFTRKFFDQFPAPPITICVYCALSNGFGQFPIKLRIERLEGIQWSYESSQNVMFLDRLAETRGARDRLGLLNAQARGAADRERLLATARKLFQWKLEMTRERG